MTQEEALKILKSGRSVFLTGIAGAGKIFVLTQYIEYLQKEEVKLAITASTGIVAAVIDGMTIHSFSGLGIRDVLSEDDLLKLRFNKRVNKRIRSINALIIDEISMLSANQLDCVNKIFKAVRNNEKPFGGVQVIFCGDFLQLPPVRGDFAFNSNVWGEMDLAICYLDKSYRQKDNELLTVLNAIRSNNITEEVISMVNNKIAAKIENFTVLFTHNVDVDAFNMTELVKLKKPSFFYMMNENGFAPVVETLKRYCLSPEKLELKVGAKVMVTRNIFSEGLVNGTLGIVTKCEKSTVTIKTNNGRVKHLKQQEWSQLDEKGKKVASIYQIPLRLAYAITIHKSQGMTLDAAVMDLSKVFTPGQGYVAFSRLRSLENLSLEGFVPQEAFLVNEECLEYEKTLML